MARKQLVPANATNAPAVPAPVPSAAPVDAPTEPDGATAAVSAAAPSATAPNEAGSVRVKAEARCRYKGRSWNTGDVGVVSLAAGERIPVHFSVIE